MEYKLRENRQVEFKRTIESYKSLNKELVAFLNDIGGEVLIGIEDDGTIIGLNEETIEKYLEEIPQAIFEGISPFCRPIVSVKNIKELQLISIQVHQGNKKPYFLKSKGIPEGVFIRIASHSMPASEDIIRDLQRSNTSVTYDQECISSTTLENFDQIVLKSHYGGTPSEENLLADKVLSFDNISKKLLPTVAGLIFFYKKPSSVLNHAEILLTKFEGTNQKRILKTRDYSSPLAQMANEVINDIKKELSSEYELVDAQLIRNKTLVPEEALREALNNALIHRKYTVNDSIKIALFDDRLEIFSPGNFPGPIANFLSGVSYSRNPAIRQLARNVGLVEKRGLGFRKIFESCKENGNPEPLITDQNGDFVKVTFFFAEKSSNYNLKKWPKELLIFEEIFSKKNDFTLLQAANLLKCSKNTAKNRISYFIENDMIENIGKGRAAHYKWKS